MTSAPETTSLNAAKSEAKRMVDGIVAAVFAGKKMEPSGRDNRPCDPPDAGIVNAVYGFKITVAPNEVDSTAVAAWAQLKQLGFLPDGPNGNDPQVGGPNAPAPRGVRGGYGASVTANRQDSIVYVEVATPCLKPGS